MQNTSEFLLPGDVIEVDNIGLVGVELVVLSVEREREMVGSPATIMVIEKTRIGTGKKQNPFELRLAGEWNALLPFEAVRNVGDVEFTMDNQLNYVFQ
ncbi:MAG: hypothetical protein WC654_07980 [Patescibacteria group bacterium]